MSKRKVETKPKPVRVRATVRVRAYPLVCDAVANGVDYGWNRAHKHTDTPNPEDTKQAICDAVEVALCELLDFDPPGVDQ